MATILDLLAQSAAEAPQTQHANKRLRTDTAVDTLRGSVPAGAPPVVAFNLCVGSVCVPVGADGMFDPFGRWLFRAVAGKHGTQAFDQGLTLKDCPTGRVLQRQVAAQRGKRCSKLRVLDAAGNILAKQVHVHVDGVAFAATSRKPLRLMATEPAVKWLVAGFHADLRMLAAASAASEVASAAAASAAAGAAASTAAAPADPRERTTCAYTPSELDVLAAHCVRVYWHETSKFLVAAPKKALEAMSAAGRNVTAAGVNKCEEKRKFRITARVKTSGTKTLNRMERSEKREKALRDCALRAMAAACEYHRGGSAAIGASHDKSEMFADESEMSATGSNVDESEMSAAGSNGSSSSRFD